MQENCDYDSEIENVLLDYLEIGGETNGNIVTHRLPHRRRYAYRVSVYDNRGGKATHSDLLRKVEAGDPQVSKPEVSFRLIEKSL